MQAQGAAFQGKQSLKTNAIQARTAEKFKETDYIRAGKAKPECLRRIAKRKIARRVSDRAFVYEHRACTRCDRDLAKGIQRRDNGVVAGRENPHPACKAIGQKGPYNAGKL